jgi:glutamine phosphoribosylpyrophosphate amidotransferase
MSLELWSDSLSYLSLEWLSKVIPEIEVEQLKVKWACMACLTWIYPTKKWIELYNKQKDS